jgi:hypothetical protein
VWGITASVIAEIAKGLFGSAEQSLFFTHQKRALRCNRVKEHLIELMDTLKGVRDRLRTCPRGRQGLEPHYSAGTNTPFAAQSVLE